MKIELDPLKDNPVKRNHPAAGEKLFTIEWLGEATEDFLTGDITRAYTDKFGTTYGESLRGSWMPVGEEGENWSWVRYNPKKGCRIGAKRNPVGKTKGRIKLVVIYEHTLATPMDVADDELKQDMEMMRGDDERRDEPIMLVDRDSSGDVIKGRWPLRNEEDIQNLSELLFGARETGQIPSDTESVILPDNSEFFIDTGKIAVSAATRATAMKMQARRASMTMKKNPVGRGDWFVLFEDAKGVIAYYAGDSDRGVRLTFRDDEARHLELRRATQLAKKLNALYAKTHKDGADFYVVAASTIKANPVYRSTEPDINEIRTRNAASGVPYERSLSLSSVDEDEQETYDVMSESALRELLRQRDPNGYATFDDEGPTDPDQTVLRLIEALTYLDDLELGR